VADAANNARINMEGLSLNDTQLQDFQSRYISMYTEIHNSTREMLAASEARNREAGREAYTAFQEATSQETNLVREINDYCAE
jgi:galactokinase/mevalonate kinase-like predicted kinase